MFIIPRNDLTSIVLMLYLCIIIISRDDATGDAREAVAPTISQSFPSALKYLKIFMHCGYFHNLHFYITLLQYLLSELESLNFKPICSRGPLEYSRSARCRHFGSIGPPAFLP